MRLEVLFHVILPSEPLWAHRTGYSLLTRVLLRMTRGVAGGREGFGAAKFLRELAREIFGDGLPARVL